MFRHRFKPSSDRQVRIFERASETRTLKNYLRTSGIYRLIAVAMVVFLSAIAIHFPFSPIPDRASAQSSANDVPTKTVPYPTRLVPGQVDCLILNDEFAANWTPQERYVNSGSVQVEGKTVDRISGKKWTVLEKVVWKKLCAGKNVNLAEVLASNVPDLNSDIQDLKSNILKYLILSDLLALEKEAENNPLDRPEKINQTVLKKLETLKDSDYEQTLDLFLSEKIRSEASSLTQDFFQALEMKQAFLNDPTRVFQSLGIANQTQSLNIFLAVDTHKNKLKVPYIKFFIDVMSVVLPDLEKLDKRDSRGRLNVFLRILYSKVMQSECEDSASEPDSRCALRKDFKKIKLSAGFLQTILLREPFRSALPEKIAIQNFIFPDEIDLSSATLDKELHLEHSVFEQDLKLYKIKTSHSLYFDNSTFTGKLALNNASIQGSLFIRNATFSPTGILKTNNNEVLLINLRDAQISESIHLQTSRLNLSSAKTTLEKNDRSDPKISIIILSFANAKIRNSIYLDRTTDKTDFLSDRETIEQWLKIDSSMLDEVTQIDLTSAQVANEVRVDIHPKQSDRRLNLESAEIKNLVLNARSPDESVRFDRNFELLYLNLNDTTLKNFQIDDSHSAQHSLDKESETANKGTLSEIQNQDPFDCKFELDGFQYQKMNEAGFKLISSCLAGQYENAQRDNLELSYNSLLQPFEQAARVARDMGKYSEEQQLLYKRKKLELFIAQLEGFSAQTLSLWMSDFLYGFGYFRLKSLTLFAFFWSVGVILAYKELYRKQQDLIEATLRIREDEIRDKKIEKDIEREDKAIDIKTLGENCSGTVQFIQDKERNHINSIRAFIDSIDEVIFNGRFGSEGLDYEANLAGESDDSMSHCNRIGLYVLFNSEFDCHNLSYTQKNPSFHQYAANSSADYDSYVKVIFERPEARSQESTKRCLAKMKNFLDLLDARNPNHVRIGFCENLFPKSDLWSIHGTLADKEKTGYLEMFSFNDRSFYYYRNLTPKTVFTFFCCFSILLLTLSLISRSLGIELPYWILSLSIFLLTLFFLPLLTDIQFLADARSQWGTQGIWGAIAASFKPLLQPNWFRRGFWNAMVFSFDILLPIIDLDADLHHFIFNDSKGITRVYFLFQKILAAVLASILLPVFFVTGF